MSFLFAMRNNPFAKLLIYYLSGILFAYAINHTGKILLPSIFLIILLIAFIILNKYPSYNTNWASGLTASLILFLAGFINLNIYFRHSQLIEKTNGYKGLAILEIWDQPVISGKYVKSVARVQAWKPSDQSEMCRQKILLYIENDSLSAKLMTGSRITAYIMIGSISPPRNPGEFNYKKYQAVRKIYNQTYIRSGQWKFADPERRQTLRIISADMKFSLLGLYQKIGLNKTLYGLLSALTLGYKNDLETHTKQAFSRAGVMHVMALSGYNVAVIVVAVSYILFFTEKIKYGLIFKTIAIILTVWIFVFITGMSPSVTRAAVMVTLVFLGKISKRNIKISNILFVSAFIILSVSPALISDISFQLSFAAVFGIITFYPPLYKLINCKFIIIDKIWQLFAVSCAAQLSTLPVTLYYFHQFPVYFWLVNLLVVPLVSLIICISAVFLLVSFIKPLMTLTGYILSFLLKILYESVDFVEVLPYSLIDNININSLQLFFIIAILILLGVFLINKRFSLIIVSLLMIVTVQLISLNQIRIWNSQKIIMIGNFKNSSVINLINGRESIVLTSPSLNIDNTNLNYSFSNFWITHGVAENVDIINLDEFKISSECKWLGNNKLFYFNEKSILWLCDNEIYDWETQTPLKIDYLIINNQLKTKVEELKKIINAKLVIIDSSVGIYKAQKWENSLKKASVKCWSTCKQGAYISDFSDL